MNEDFKRLLLHLQNLDPNIEGWWYPSRKEGILRLLGVNNGYEYKVPLEALKEPMSLLVPLYYKKLKGKL